MKGMKVTTDHGEIKAWITSQNGKPDIMLTPGVGNSEVGLRIDFPGKEDEVYLNDSIRSVDVSWDDFFAKFEEMGLAFMYEEGYKGKNPVDAYRFIKRENADEEEE